MADVELKELLLTQEEFEYDGVGEILERLELVPAVVDGLRDAVKDRDWEEARKLSNVLGMAFAATNAFAVFQVSLEDAVERREDGRLP